MGRLAKGMGLGVLLMAVPAVGQARIGLLTTQLSGTISPGYSADFGNQTSSDHSWTIGGAGTLSGSFYNPNFLSFNASFYLNQSRANSDFQSISNASGFDLSSTVFGGSRFPGTVGYSKAYNSEGNYAVPGLADYVTHGNNDTFGITWSENLVDKPTVSASFQSGSSQYTVYGASESGTNTFRSLNLHSSYRADGFNLGGYYSNGSSHALIPQVVTGEAASESDSSNNALGFNASHALPMAGNISAALDRSSWNQTYAGANSTGTIDLLNITAAVHPRDKLAFTGNLSYSDNLSGQLIEAVITAGGVVPGLNSNMGSHALDLMAVASYAPWVSLQASAYVERRTQYFLGQNYGVTSIGMTGSYSHVLLNGTLNSTVNLTENTSDQTGDETLGFATNETYTNVVKGWHVTGTFGYAQNAETLLVTYTNSFYNFSGNVRRNWGKKLDVSVGAGGSRTGLTDQAGTSNSSQDYNATVGYGTLLTANGSYSKADGQALATGSGLIPVPIPSPVVPSSQVSLYGGESYSFGLSSSPVKKLLLEGSYSSSTSNTSSNGIASNNQNTQFNGLVQYQTRKLYINGGFARLEQGFSSLATPAQVINSFSIGVSRWFNVF